MKTTRFMEVMFSNKDEDLANQVDNDIKKAQAEGVVDTEEVKYERTGDGDVAITDKGSGEVTIAQKSTDEPDTYDLIAVPDEQLEKFLHPSADGFTVGDQIGTPDEHATSHLCGGSISSDSSCEDDRQFSVTSDNTAWQRLFSLPQEFADYLFSEVIESEETAKVGDLKVEKCADESNAVVVTSESTGDQVKVKLENDEMEVTELESRNFDNGGSEQYLPLFVVGVEPYDHIIVDAQEWDEASAYELKARLEEDGVEAVEIFDNQEEARDYAMNLLRNLGAKVEEGGVGEPELQKEYSYSVGAPVYASSYYTDNTVFMSRMFSENEVGVSDTMDAVEDAIENDEETEVGNATIIPVDERTAIIQDGDEVTKATIRGEHIKLEDITQGEADEILSEVNEKKFSGIYTDETQTRFFSEGEYMTSYMERLFSDEADQNKIEDAIKDGEQIENESEVITPINDSEAVIEDKETGEFTKATILDDNRLDVEAISEEEADKLTEDLAVEGEEEKEKEYSNIYCDETQTRFFSEGEYMTSYMERLFSEESNQDKIEDAIESGEEIENETEIITPINDSEAVIEDKETGEFTKAEILDEDSMDLSPISEKEAENLTKDIAVGEEEKEYSDVYCDENETRFFSEGEYLTSYMERLFSEEADQNKIEDAIAKGEQVENDTEVITPINDSEAVIEDKETGEFTKATLSNEDELNVEAITEEEADELTDGLVVEDAEEEKKDEKKLDKNFSGVDLLSKFFADAGIAQQPAAPQVPVAPQPVMVDANGQPVQPVAQEPAQPAPTVEEIEDKALAAIQSIKAAVEEGTSQIMDAKASPAVSAEPEIQEAQFSQKAFGQNNDNSGISWL